MKFLIFVSVALSVGLEAASKATKLPKYSQKQVEDQLDKLFGLKAADIKKACNLDIKDTYPTVSEGLEGLQKAADNLENDLKKTVSLKDPKFGTKIEEKCKASPEYAEARKPVVNKALPCNAAARKAQALTFAEKNSCRGH